MAKNTIKDKSEFEEVAKKFLKLLRQLPRILERIFVELAGLWVESYDKRHPNKRHVSCTKINNNINSPDQKELNAVRSENEKAKDTIEGLNVQIKGLKELNWKLTIEKEELISTNDFFLSELNNNKQKVIELENEIQILKDKYEKPKILSVPHVDKLPSVLYAEADASEPILRRSSEQKKPMSLFELHINKNGESCQFIVMNSERTPYIIQNRSQFLKSCDIVEINPDAKSIQTLEPGTALKDGDVWRVTKTVKIKLN